MYNSAYSHATSHHAYCPSLPQKTLQHTCYSWGLWYCLLTYSMEQSPSWEANKSLQLVKKFPEFLWNSKVPHHTHMCPPPVPILSHHHPIPTTPSNFLKIHLNIILPSTSGSPQWPLSLRLPHQHPVHTSLLPHTHHMPHSILLDFTTRTILGKVYRSFSSSLCNFLHSPVTSSLLGPNTLRWYCLVLDNLSGFLARFKLCILKR
jgi:hypothetical protein